MEQCLKVSAVLWWSTLVVLLSLAKLSSAQAEVERLGKEEEEVRMEQSPDRLQQDRLMSEERQYLFEQDPDGVKFEQVPERFASERKKYLLEQDPDGVKFEQAPERFASKYLLEQDPDGVKFEQVPERFASERRKYLLEQDPDGVKFEQGFKLEQEPPDRGFEQDPDGEFEQDPDRFMSERRNYLEQDPDGEFEQDPDKFMSERRYLFEQDPDGVKLAQDPDGELEQDPDGVKSEGGLKLEQMPPDDVNKVQMEERPVAEQDRRRLEFGGMYRQGKKEAGEVTQRMKDNKLVRELADIQAEAKKAASTTRPKKIIFDESDDSTEDILEKVAKIEGNAEVESDTDDDDDMALNQWVMVTSEGYEYHASQKEVAEVLAMSEELESSKVSFDSSYNLFDESSETSSFFEASINATDERVFGRDSRFLVRNTLRYPWSAMGRIDTGCTGTFIGPRHILTAGHCVYNPSRGRWRRNLNFRRAKNCDPNRGYFYRWKTAVTTRGWMRGRRAYDYAVIVVSGSSPSWMSFGYRTYMPRYIVNLAGYPGDKSGNCMWHAYCRLRYRFRRILTHRCDTYNGMSGSAVYAKFSRYSRIIYGVHTGHRYFYNVAVRINRKRFNVLRYIMKRYR